MTIELSLAGCSLRRGWRSIPGSLGIGSGARSIRLSLAGGALHSCSGLTAGISVTDRIDGAVGNRSGPPASG